MQKNCGKLRKRALEWIQVADNRAVSKSFVIKLHVLALMVCHQAFFLCV